MTDAQADPPATSAKAGGEMSYGRGAALLSVLIGTTGLLTYAFFAISSQTLGATSYGGITVLWATVFITASIIYRPVEQLLSRTIADHHARGHAIGGTLRVAATIQLGLAALVVAAGLLLRNTIEQNLFDGDSTLYWSLIAAVTFYAASYFARGFLAGHRRFGLYGGLVMMESASRLAIVLLLAFGVFSGRDPAALAIAAGPLLSLIVVPLALGHHVRRTVPSAPGAGAEPGEPEFTMAHGVGFAGAVLVVMSSEQAILNSGTVIVALTAEGNSLKLAALVFNVLLIARAPLQLFQAVSTTLLPHLTRLVVHERDQAHGGDFGRSVRLTVLACLGFGAATVVGVLAVGPPVMKLVFGSEFIYDRGGLAMVAAGMGLYLSATTLNQAVLAQGRARLAAISWATAATFFVAFLLIADISVVREVEVAFLATAVLLSGLLYLAYRRPVKRGEHPVRPGSVEELEARLAAADEAS